MSEVQQIRKAAHRLLCQVEGEVSAAEVDGVLSRCADHLRQVFEVAPDDAYDHALAAWSEIEGRRSRCYVDLEMSTAHLVFLVDPVARTRHAIPSVDLLRLIGPRLVKPAGSAPG